MAHLLIVAHAPLASALLAVARHVYPECGGSTRALDVDPAWSLEQAERAVSAALAAQDAGASGADTLVLTDVFGATPCKAAQAALAERARARLVVGVNVPMLWRVLCYADKPIEDLVERAVGGAQSGVLHVPASRRQNQPSRAASDDQARHHDQ
jgi:mannose PTS system EIIA component